MLTACKANYHKANLYGDFTPSELKDLNKIVKFFKDETCGTADFEKCFRQINYDSLISKGMTLSSKIDFEKQKKLYRDISSSTFDAIWMFCESFYHPTQTKAEDLCLSTNRKYLNYLKAYGRDNPKIADYSKRLEGSGDFNHFDFDYREILAEKEYFDLADFNMQLVLAIHYLSLNDQSKRNADLRIQKYPNEK